MRTLLFDRKLLGILFSVVSALVLVTSLIMLGGWSGQASANPATSHAAAATNRPGIDCASGDFRCVEVADSDDVFGYYVGHDEPSLLYYSNVPGSGNSMQYTFSLPVEPPATNPMVRGKSYSFELMPAFWFGMVMCATQSYPELLSTCTPDSDTNIVDPSVSPKHAGEAYMELQLYPPGWVQQFTGFSCNGTQWCAALTIDSLALNPINGQTLNSTCLDKVGEEYVNFAYLTKNGIPQGAPNPVDFNPSEETPNPQKVLFMNQGDTVTLTMHDTSNGFFAGLQDQTTGQSGSMTASAANGFGQVQFAPTGTSCVNLPYDFHPMYSTSSEMTRDTWAAGSYNIAYDTEIGHFDFCNGATVPFVFLDGANCPSGNTEGVIGDQEPTDSDDVACFPASASTLIPVQGCLGENDPGFDGTSYQDDWPDGNTNLHPTSVKVSSPLTGPNYTTQYSRVAFEADLPAIEFTTCDVATGTGCTLIPPTDDGSPATFYPFYSIISQNGTCVWRFGNHQPGSTNDFKQNQQYGTLLSLSYTTTGGGYVTAYEDFRQILSYNPCPAP
jgi:hypothetical protein